MPISKFLEMWALSLATGFLAAVLMHAIGIKWLINYLLVSALNSWIISKIYEKYRHE